MVKNPNILDFWDYLIPSDKEHILKAVRMYSKEYANLPMGMLPFVSYKKIKFAVKNYRSGGSGELTYWRNLGRPYGDKKCFSARKRILRTLNYQWLETQKLKRLGRR